MVCSIDCPAAGWDSNLHNDRSESACSEQRLLDMRCGRLQHCGKSAAASTCSTVYFGLRNPERAPILKTGLIVVLIASVMFTFWGLNSAPDSFMIFSAVNLLLQPTLCRTVPALGLGLVVMSRNPRGSFFIIMLSSMLSCGRGNSGPIGFAAGQPVGGGYNIAPFQGIESCMGPDGRLTTPCTPLNDNIELGCRGITHLAELTNDRTLARMAPAAVAAAFSRAVAFTGFQKYMQNHRNNSRWNFNEMSRWSNVDTGEWWGSNFWFCLGFFVGILLLLDCLFHTLPLLWCGFYRRYCCVDNWRRPRTSLRTAMSVTYVCSIASGFFIIVSILFAVWLQWDVKGSSCAPHVWTSRVLYDGTLWNSKTSHRFDGIFRMQDNFESYRKIDEAVYKLEHNDLVNENVLYGPLKFFIATEEFLATTAVKRPAAGGSFENSDGEAFLHHLIAGYDEKKWLFDDTSSVGGLKDEAAFEIANALKETPAVFDRIQTNVESAVETLVNHLYPKLVQEFVKPIHLKWQGSKVQWGFAGLLIFLSVPAVGLAAAIFYLLRHKISKDYTDIRATGWGRRTAGFFVFGFCFWASILWLTSGFSLMWLSSPSEVCRWFEQDILEDGQMAEFKFVKSTITREYYNYCMKDDAATSTFEQFGAPVNVLTQTDIFNTSVPQGYIQQLQTEFKDVSFKLQGQPETFSSSPAKTLHTRVIDYALPDSWADVKDAWESSFHATGEFPACAFDGDIVCLENIPPSKAVSCKLTILRSWIAAASGDTASSLIDIASRDDILADAPADANDAYQSFLSWMDNCTQNGDPVLEKKLTNLIYAGTLKSMIASNDNKVASSANAPKPCDDGCSVFSSMALWGVNRGGLLDSGSYENWVKDATEAFGQLARDSGTYADYVNNFIVMESRIGAIRNIVTVVDTDFDCKEATNGVKKISDGLCHEVVGRIAVITYCCLGLAVLHTVAYIVFLRYWKARKTYDDYLRQLWRPSVSQDEFLRAAEGGDFVTVKAGADFYQPDTTRDVLYSNTPLHLAAFYGNDGAVVYLLQKGYDPNAQNNHFKTPFTATCANLELEWPRKEQILKMLHDHGAEVDIYDYEGDTALIRATREGDERLVQWLLDVGANPLIRGTVQGEDSLKVASSRNFQRIQTLLDQASPRHKPGLGRFETSSSSASRFLPVRSARSP